MDCPAPEDSGWSDAMVLLIDSALGSFKGSDEPTEAEESGTMFWLFVGVGLMAGREGPPDPKEGGSFPSACLVL